MCISTADNADGPWQLLLQMPWEAPGAPAHPAVAAAQPQSSSGHSGFFAICSRLLSASASYVSHGLLQSSQNQFLCFRLSRY